MITSDMTDKRLKYLKELAEEYEVDFYKVLFIAQLYGSGEDYDGLVNAVQDLVYWRDF